MWWVMAATQITALSPRRAWPNYEPASPQTTNTAVSQYKIRKMVSLMYVFHV